MLDAAAGVLVAVAALVALARLDGWIVVVIALATPFVFVIVRVLIRETALSTVAYQEHQAEVATRFVAALHGARTIRACDTVDREIARVSEPLAALQAAGRAVWQTLGRTAGRAGLVVPLVGVGALAVAGQGVAAGRLTPGELIAAAGYVPIALGLFDHVSNLGSLAVDRACAVRVAEELACPTAPGRNPPPRTGTRRARPARRRAWRPTGGGCSARSTSTSPAAPRSPSSGTRALASRSSRSSPVACGRRTRDRSSSMAWRSAT